MPSLPGRRPRPVENDPETQRPHLAARVEDRYHAVLGRVLRARGWRPRVVPHTGYGSTTRVRVLGRVLLTSRSWFPGRDAAFERRGYRNFFAAPAPGEPVRVTIGTQDPVTVDLVADRGGYLDATVDVDLAPGWHEVAYRTRAGAPVLGRVHVVAPGARLGVVSDIDDTVMVTALPRPLVAAWNTFARHPSARMPVRGMAELYASIRREHPDAPFVYLSTGAWNTADTLRRFMDRHGFPPGPMLLTDWGPTNTGWFRSGPAHKNAALDRLVRELPDVRWLLVGDDGQHDPAIYARACALHPQHVAAVAIRRLTPTQQVLAHGTPVPQDGGATRVTRPRPAQPVADDVLPVPAGRPATVGAPDGYGLRSALRGLLPRP
ncbi:phosphatidate phosphatase APP1 [Sediminihabitans luteus]|uniref:Phosphatidate phosphatase APP1 n=1 Tax=Sediminihabitans luteus TaxID=1138585 RepID=A0A2M9CD75_9CELL|nr:phosphatase domain-containing protein [Sediminihabitans luteus]PJJ69251.1 phosphatidate phosphatase APP1 [Sediminihabitans luteus]GII98927.1 hypothetical protein Slu03_13050 [Sediminihabitans luteus]